MKVKWTAPAAEQLEKAYHYIAAENEAAAEALANRIIDVTVMLGAHPMAGRKGRVAGTREFAVPRTPFVVAYKLERASLWILAVYHAARKWPESF